MVTVKSFELVFMGDYVIPANPIIVVFLGPWKPDADQLYGIRVTKNAEKNNGIFFNNLGIHVKTFENLNIKVQERAADLRGISRTLRGRLNLILSFIAAKIW